LGFLTKQRTAQESDLHADGHPGSGQLTEGQLTVGSLRAWLPRSRLALTTRGTVRFGGGPPQLALEGNWTELRWPLAGAPVVESASGLYTLKGAMPYAFSVRAGVRGPSIPAAQFDATGSFDSAQLVLERVSGSALDGRILGSGRLSWAKEQSWRFQIEGKALDISQLRPEVRGRINVNGSIEGRGFTMSAPWTARIASLSGTLFGRALTGRGEIAHRDGTFELRQVRASNGASHVDVNGRWGQSVDLRWDADLRSLAIVAPGLSGELVSSGSLKGTAARPQASGEAHLHHLRYGAVTVASADATLDVDTGDQRPSRVDLRASGLTAGALRFQTVKLRASGLTREHGLDLEFVSPGSPEQRLTEFHGVISARGSFDTPSRAWRGSLTTATFTFPDGEAKLLQPAALELSPRLIRAAPVCLARDQSRLCVEGERQAQPESWRVLYSAQDWPLRRILRTLLGWHQFDGQLQASGWAEKQPGRDWVGGTALALDHPTLDVPRNSYRSERIELGGGRLDLYAQPDSLRANLDLNVAGSTHILGEAVAERRPGSDLLASALHGSLRGESAALSAMSLLVPELDRSSGSLDGQVTLAGTLGEPRFNGEFRIRDGLFALYRTNFVLSKVEADGKFVGDQLSFEARGETAKGKVTLDGRFGWPEGVMTGTMHLKGDHLLVADTPEYRISASPNLTLLAGAGGYEIEGEIQIPQAKISPKDLSTSVSTSADERVIGIEVEDTGPKTLERIRSRVHVVMGEDVHVDSYGLKARLGGAVTVVTNPHDVARGQGEINVVEGQYKAFGQDVKITKGRLIYANTPLTEPLLELTAERTIKDQDITVAVNVRGSLSRPFISISSTPAMSTNEALSYLLTGRSLNTLQSGEASSVNRAASNLALSGGGLLLGGIGSRLGLDEVSMEQTQTSTRTGTGTGTGATTGTTDTSVVFGKFLSPQLFISYGVSIAEAINTIKLRYTINEKWALKAEAGLVQGGDIEYKIER